MGPVVFMRFVESPQALADEPAPRRCPAAIMPSVAFRVRAQAAIALYQQEHPVLRRFPYTTVPADPPARPAGKPAEAPRPHSRYPGAASGRESPAPDYP